MRLIDLDKALAEAEDECRMSDDWKVSHEMMNVFKYQQIIKAIPIEWIKKQIEWYRKKSEYLDKKYGDKQDFVNDAEIAVFYYEALIKDWEKENEEMV